MSRDAPIDIVVLDCDSTLSAIEGIDELAERCGVGAEVRQLTDAAMSGTLPLDSVYGKRLQLIRPDRSTIDWLAQRYVDNMVDGAGKLVATLQRLDKQVHIVSGGIRQAVLPLAAALGVVPRNIHAVDIWHDDEGRYTGFDRQSPLVRNGGKAQICKTLSADSGLIAAIGDGVTDLEMAASGAEVIGFGGVVTRPQVETAVDHFVRGPSLLAVLPYLLTAVELRGVAGDIMIDL